jgi:cytoskeletal protein RodZ
VTLVVLSRHCLPSSTDVDVATDVSRRAGAWRVHPNPDGRGRIARSVMVSQPEGVTDRDARRVRAKRRSRLVWAGAVLMVVGVTLLAVVLIGGLRSSNVSTRPSPSPSTSEEPPPPSTSEEPESPAPSPTSDETEGSPPADTPSSTPSDEGPVSPPPPSAPRAVTVTVTETTTAPAVSGGGATGSGLDVPSTITAVAGLISAGVGAASYLAGKKRDRLPAGESAAR